MVTNSTLISGLALSEIELNPTGEDRGNEWVELYSAESVNLEEYTLVNGRGIAFNLSGTLQGYAIFHVPGNWLVNTNASVLLRHEETILQHVESLEDTANNANTWSACGSEWTFGPGSPEDDNGCPSSEEREEEEVSEAETSVTSQTSGLTTNNTVVSQNELEEENEEPRETIQGSVSTPISYKAPAHREKIVLGLSEEKKEEPTYTTELTTSEGFVRDNVLYVFAGICVGIIVLLLLKKI